MRVAFVNQDRGVGPAREKGAAVHLRALRRALAERGADVLALDEPDDGALERRLEEEHAREALDLVYERYALGKTTACRFAVRHGAPFALEVNAPLVQEAADWRGRAPRPEDAAAEREVFAGADRVFAVSTPVAEYVRSRGGRDVVVCPNGVDARRFVPGQDSALRDELVPAGRLAVGFHGRLRPWHGLELLGAALARLLEDGVGVHVVTVGNGDYAEVLSRSVPETHRTHVGWTPHDAVASYVGCFDALPLCYGESVYFSPLKLAEGMACGAVPVVPWSGDWCRFLEHGVNAMMYAAGDATGLARGLATLAGDPEQRRRLARAARITAGGMSWDSIAERVLAVARARRAARVRP